MPDVTITEVVYLWFQKFGVPEKSNKPLYEAFPDVKPTTLKQIKKRYLDGFETRKKAETPAPPIPKVTKRKSPKVTQNEIDDSFFDDLDFDDNGDTIDPSFKKLIHYSKYAADVGVEITTNTILSHLDKTSQLKQSEDELIDYADLVDKLEDLWGRLQNENESSLILDSKL